MRVVFSRRAALRIFLMTTLFIPARVFAVSDSFAGSWKMNLAKSKLDPDRHPASATMRFDPTPTGYRLTVEGVHEAGDKVSNTVELNLDGRDHLVPGEFPEMLKSASRPKPNLIEINARKGGQLVSRNTIEVSKDGKRLTSTIYTKEGKKMSVKSVGVFDRQ